MTRMTSSSLLAVTISLFLSGCVDPGRVDVDDVYRLQQALLASNPQDRSEDSLGPMTPAMDRVPDIAVRTDPDTGMTLVPLELRDAVMRALANNTDIAVVAYDPQISRQQVIQAAAAFDYTIFGDWSYVHNDSSRLNKIGTPNTRNRTLDWGLRQQTVTGGTWSFTNSYVRSWDDTTALRFYEPSMELAVTQPLLRGAWPEVNLASLRIARLNHKITLEQFREEVQRIITEVITTYYQLQQAQEEIRIASNLLEATAETYEYIKEREKLDATKVQIKQAELAVKTREAVLLQARKTAKDVQDSLVRIIGDSQINLMEDVQLLPETPLADAPVVIDEADQLLTAIRLNPTLEQLRLAIQQADIGIRVAENETLPQVDFIAGVGLNGASSGTRGDAWRDMWDGQFVDYNFAIQAEYPLGNRQRNAALAQSRLERLQAISRFQNTADQLAQTVRERIRQIRTRYEELQIQRVALDAASQQLEALENLQRIRASLTPEFLNLKLNAQASVAEARRNEIAALVNYNTAMLDLAQATGAVLEMNQVKLAMPVVAQPPRSDDATVAEEFNLIRP